jgi:hypothetical protein
MNKKRSRSSRRQRSLKKTPRHAAGVSPISGKNADKTLTQHGAKDDATKGKRLTHDGSQVDAAQSIGSATPTLPSPLDHEHFIESFQKSLTQIKAAGQTTLSFAAVLEQWSQILQAEWAREKLETSSPNHEFQYIT